MHFHWLAAASTLFASTFVVSAPTPASDPSQSYIVVLQDGVDKAGFLAALLPQLAPSESITYADWSSDLLNGFAAKCDALTLALLRADSKVRYVEEDGVMTTRGLATQTDATWGLQRISQADNISKTDTSALDYTYRYDSSAGQGVDVYVVDTGIYVEHNQFGGRARWGAVYGGYEQKDGNGHGTHCSGTVGGKQFGVAKAVNLIAVKVLSDQGSGAVSDIISGLDYVTKSARESGRPSVVSMSLGGSVNEAMDEAVKKLVASGVHVAVAAGNDNTLAEFTSPARVKEANTVGASTIADERASFSNYGPSVDIWAPGLEVISSWIGSPDATNKISGTSMATPHVAGLIAYLLSRDGTTTPAAMSSKLKSTGKPVVEGTLLSKGTLANNGY